jgi:hypothetical protein
LELAVNPKQRIVIAIVLLFFAILFLFTGGFSRSALRDVAADYQTFVTVFLGIFIEALPFLLLGTLASGLVEVFVSREALSRMVPR